MNNSHNKNHNDLKHEHKHDSFAELFEYRNVAKKRLIISLVITLVVMIVEIVGGIITGSIALISDAGHMFTHSFAIGISLIAIIIARKPRCHHRTFGLYRAEVLAAFINGLVLLFVVGIIIYEAVQRIIHPEEIIGLQMLVVALIGLIVNVTSILILRGGHRTNLNIRGVFYHMIADAASSVGIVIAAIIISYTGWNILDPIVSIGISIVILYWAIGILRESSVILLEMAPRGLDVDTIEKDLLKEFPNIKNLENIHIWSITSDMFVFSTHIRFKKEDTNYNEKLLSKICRYLKEKYRFIETTIQQMNNWD